MNVLIVEDEHNLSREMGIFLSKENYTCDFASTRRDASEKIFVNNYDFILLDLGLPDGDGMSLIEEARNAEKEASFIILTARGATNDKIAGLNLGADDYVAKPFSLPELHSRMQAITRRRHGLKKNTINFYDFVMDIPNRSVKYGDKEITLTKKEFDILHYLLLNKNRVLTRLQLTEHIWGNILEDDYDSNYMDVHMKNLRKKLSVHAETDWLETVRGIGYKVSLK
ncbi:MAG: response regulator transcription factor [Bacteroidia bacterium]